MNSPLPTPQPTPAADVSSQLPPELRVLLVDDQDDMLTMMNLLFKGRAYDVQTANSATRALQVAEDFAPHIVVSDISMPDMSGYALMSRLRTMNGMKPFKSIALSGYDREDDLERARDAGFDAHLSKPIDFEALFAKMDELMTSA